MESTKSQYVNDEEEDKLWKEYKKSKSNSLRETLIRKYIPLVKYVAGRICVRVPKSFEFDDLVGFGNFGLIDAIDKYDLDKNGKFKTYAAIRIRDSILYEIRIYRKGLICQNPRWMMIMNRIKCTIANLEIRLSRCPTDDEVAEELNISVDEYRKWLVKVSVAYGVPLTDSYAKDDISVPYIDKIAKDFNLDVQTEKKEIQKVITQAINELPDKEMEVIVLYYHEDLTFEEIGKVLVVSESRISQLHSLANAHLRAKFTNLKKEFLAYGNS